MAIELTIPGSGADLYPLPYNANVKISQSFQDAGGFTFDNLTLGLSLVAGTPGTITVELYAADGSGFPTGALLASDTYAAASLASYPSFSYVAFDMAATVLAAGTSYVFTITTNGGTYPTDYIYVRATLGNPYANGSSSYYTDSWHANGTYDLGGTLRSAGAHAKATNPTPANAATEVDFATPTLDWDGTGDTYTVWIATAGGGFIASDIVATDIVATTYTLTTAQKAKFTGLSDVLYWRVNSTADGSELTGDTWTFDPRPGKASAPTPANAGSDIETTTAFDWTLGTNGLTNELLIGGTSYLNSNAVTYSMTSDLFDWDAAVTWSVNTTNYYGTTAGTEWAFDAMSMDHLRVTYTLITGGSGLGPYDTPTPGVEGTDYWFTGENNVITLKRLIVVSKDRMLYESL